MSALRYLGTLMVLACVVMLLFPSFWEARRHAEPPAGQSTLTQDDLVPAWRGPTRRGDEDG